MVGLAVIRHTIYVSDYDMKSGGDEVKVADKEWSIMVWYGKG